MIRASLTSPADQYATDKLLDLKMAGSGLIAWVHTLVSCRGLIRGFIPMVHTLVSYPSVHGFVSYLVFLPWFYTLVSHPGSIPWLHTRFHTLILRSGFIPWFHTRFYTPVSYPSFIPRFHALVLPRPGYTRFHTL